MDSGQGMTLATFVAQTDTVGKAILIVLIAMSVVTWYLIVTKAVQAWMIRSRTATFLQSFWSAPSMPAVALRLEERSPDEPFSRLSHSAIAASKHHQRHGSHRLDEAGSASEFLLRSMRRVIDEETARLESGLTILASIGSTAPFVGLFGTVWGVYHALAAIGLSGQGTLDKVAGPVGEALIMTAAGLAVAIPAVLAYNALVRSNRVVLSRLDAFAHDLFAFLTTGSHVREPVGNSARRPAAVAGEA